MELTLKYIHEIDSSCMKNSLTRFGDIWQFQNVKSVWQSFLVHIVFGINLTL